MPSSGSVSKPASYDQRNSIEALSDLGTSVVRSTASSMKEIGTSMFDQLLGNYPGEQKKGPEQQFKKYESPRSRRKIETKTVFTFQQEQDSRMIKSLVEQIKQEVKMLQQADKSLMSEVKDIEKLTLSSSEERPGIYHVRFMEVVLQVLKMLRAKVNESRTWLHTISGRGKKQGSFGANASRHGTQYSQSQELSVTRSR